MKKAKIVNSIVENIIEVDSTDIPSWCKNWPTVTDDIIIGSSYVKGIFSPPTKSAEEAIEVVVPKEMSFAQALIGLVTEEWITEEEGNDWLDGKLPATVEALIESLPQEERFIAKARAKRPSVILRNNTLLEILANMNDKTPNDLDSFFIKYSNI